MRKSVLVLLLAAGVGFALVVMAVMPSAIAPLLPGVVGETSCFAGTFDGMSLAARDWSRSRLVATGRQLASGQPEVRNQPFDLGARAVVAITHAMTLDDRKADYERIYNFRMTAKVEGFGKPLRAEGECPWFSPTVQLPGLEPAIFGCGIDCDGGAVGIARVPGKPAIRVIFGHLRMKRQCGGGGSVDLSAAGPDVAFELSQRVPEVCHAAEQAPSEN